MSVDPHALAKIRTRQLLQDIEQLLTRIAASNAEVSEAGLFELARLRRRLSWCDECYSRHRSRQILNWILKIAAELVLRVIEASYCFQPAGNATQCSYDDYWWCNQDPQTVRWLLPEGVRQRARHFAVLSVAD